MFTKVWIYWLTSKCGSLFRDRFLIIMIDKTFGCFHHGLPQPLTQMRNHKSKVSVILRKEKSEMFFLKSGVWPVYHFHFHHFVHVGSHPELQGGTKQKDTKHRGLSWHEVTFGRSVWGVSGVWRLVFGDTPAAASELVSHNDLHTCVTYKCL